MLQDQSPEKVETVKFLERRLSDFQAMGSVKNSVGTHLFALFWFEWIHLGIQISLGYGSDREWITLCGMWTACMSFSNLLSVLGP